MTQQGTEITCHWALSCVNGDPQTRTCMLKRVTFEAIGEELRCKQFKWIDKVEELITR